MRTNRRAIAIINRNYVVIRQQPPLCRTVFSEATGQTPIPGRFFQSSYAKMHMPSAFPILFGIIHVPFDSFISQNEGNAELNNSRNCRAIIHGPAVTSEAGLPTYRELDDVLRLIAIAGQPLIDGSNSSGPDQHSKPCVRAERENHSMLSLIHI